jgi:hypothetical protein
MNTMFGLERSNSVFWAQVVLASVNATMVSTVMEYLIRNFFMAS